LERVEKGEIVEMGQPSAGNTPFIDAPVGTLTLVPVWKEVSVEGGSRWPAPHECIVMIGSTEKQQMLRCSYPKAYRFTTDPANEPAELEKELKAVGSIDHVFWFALETGKITRHSEALVEQRNAVLSLFRLLKVLVQLGYETRRLGLTAITTRAQAIYHTEEIVPSHASVHGLIGSVVKEFPAWRVRLIDYDGDSDEAVAESLVLPPDRRGNAWVSRERSWYQQQLIQYDPPELIHSRFRMRGVYVVVGGAGGLGIVLSEYLIRTYRAQVIWIGRRMEDGIITSERKRLAALGPMPEYIAADASDGDALAAAWMHIRARYGAVHGVVHSALVLANESLVRMSEDRFEACLRSKLDSSICLGEVCRGERLDFLLFFSSMVSFLKPAGYSVYGAGCTFQDAWALRLGRLLDSSVKVMNWGYWGSVGVVASEAYRRRMARLGWGSVEPTEAMAALETLLAGPLDQMVFLKTTEPEAALELGVSA
jgi:NAD(P)-dependent dehydrogenase (short-subunit alcohol dehydrogenase family)